MSRPNAISCGYIGCGRTHWRDYSLYCSWRCEHKAEARIRDLAPNRNLAARAIRTAGSDAATLPSSGVAATSAAVVSSHGTAARGCGISSTGSVPCSPVVAGPVDPFGSGSTRSPSPDERPSVAPLPSL